MYKKYDNEPPITLNITGNNFIYIGINSESTKDRFLGWTNKALPQKSVPNPIIMSFSM